VTDEAVRGWIVEELQTIAGGFDEELVIDWRGLQRHERGTGLYHSLCGPVPVRRHTYRRWGCATGQRWYRWSWLLGSSRARTPALACNVAHGYAQHDMRLHEEMLTLAHRQTAGSCDAAEDLRRTSRCGGPDSTADRTMVRRAEAEPEEPWPS